MDKTYGYRNCGEIKLLVIDGRIIIGFARTNIYRNVEPQRPERSAVREEQSRAASPTRPTTVHPWGLGKCRYTRSLWSRIEGTYVRAKCPGRVPQLLRWVKIYCRNTTGRTTRSGYREKNIALIRESDNLETVFLTFPLTRHWFLPVARFMIVGSVGVATRDTESNGMIRQLNHITCPIENNGGSIKNPDNICAMDSVTTQHIQNCTPFQRHCM